MSIIAAIERHPRPAHTHRSNARIPQDYGNSACLFMWEFGDADYHNYDHHYCHDDYYKPSAITSTVLSVAGDRPRLRMQAQTLSCGKRWTRGVVKRAICVLAMGVFTTKRARH